MTAWRKRGLFVAAPPPLPWAASHAALPAPLGETADGRLALLFSTRDAEGRSHVACAEVDPRDPLTSPRFSTEPVLAPGELGAFDDSGTTTSCVIEVGGVHYLYYSGWSLGRTVPFTFFVGCATSEDGGATWRRASLAPVLGRTDVDPFLTASPCVLVEEGRFRMWYVSGVRWRIVAGEPRHWYHVRYAESRDGLQWEPTGRVCIDFRDGDEYAIGRPCVIRDGDRYRMWFSARGDAYRLGYAESADGLTWERDDAAAELLPPSTDGWDSEMVAYPWVVDVGGERLLLYNGNGYGATGIGYAVAG